MMIELFEYNKNQLCNISFYNIDWTFPFKVYHKYYVYQLLFSIILCSCILNSFLLLYILHFENINEINIHSTYYILNRILTIDKKIVIHDIPFLDIFLDTHLSSTALLVTLTYAHWTTHFNLASERFLMLIWMRPVFISHDAHVHHL